MNSEKCIGEGGEELYLFRGLKIRNPAYWQCIRYIAPTSEPRKWTSADAVGVFCMECRIRINYHNVKNSKGVKRHMEKYHMNLLESFNGGYAAPTLNLNKRLKTEGGEAVDDIAVPQSPEAKRPKTGGSSSSAVARIDSSYSKRGSGVNNNSSTNNRAAIAAAAQHSRKDQFQWWIARWTGVELLRFSECQSKSLFQAMLANLGGSTNSIVPMPTAEANRKAVIHQVESLKDKMMGDITANCSYYAVTLEVWSPQRTWTSCTAVTLRFLTEDFEQRTYVLQVQPRRHHKAMTIHKELESTLEKWTLDTKHMAMLLRDSGPILVQACQDLPHYPSMGHAFHWIVGPLLILLPNQSSDVAKKNDKTEEDDELDYTWTTEEDDIYCDGFDPSHVNAPTVVEIRSVVQDLHTIYAFVKYTSPMPIVGLNDILKANNDEDTKHAVRWTSALSMIKVMLGLVQPIQDFLENYHSPAGQREWEGKLGTTLPKLPNMTNEKWALLQGLSYLLIPFEKTWKFLTEEKYGSSFVYELPYLHKLKEIVSNTNMMNFEDATALNASKKKKQFYDQYNKYPFFGKVTKKLETCRKLLYKELCQHFIGGSNYVWVTLLDPGVAFHSTHWSSSEEKDAAKKSLIQEAQQLAAKHAMQSDASKTESEDEFDDEFATICPLWKPGSAGNPTAPKQKDMELTELYEVVSKEVDTYLADIQTPRDPKYDPLEWWRKNREQYPNVARAARKWMAVGSSHSSTVQKDGVFKICDLLDRTRDGGYQVFLRTNYEQCERLK